MNDMKRTIAFLVCVLLAVFSAIALAEADVAVNAKNFPDAGFRQYILNAGFDTDGNGMLSDEELSWVTEIDCTAMSIADLTGIRQFTALERLFCGNNDLSALALNGCAALTAGHMNSSCFIVKQELLFIVRGIDAQKGQCLYVFFEMVIENQQERTRSLPWRPAVSGL